jgi:hypothetical protein
VDLTLFLSLFTFSYFAAYEPKTTKMVQTCTTLVDTEGSTHLVDAEGLPTTHFAQTREKLIVTTRDTKEMEENLVLADRCGQREKMHNPNDLIELARHVQSADSHTKAIASGKLELISKQIASLQVCFCLLVCDLPAKIPPHAQHSPQFHQRNDLCSARHTNFDNITPLTKCFAFAPAPSLLNPYHARPTGGSQASSRERKARHGPDPRQVQLSAPTWLNLPPIPEAYRPVRRRARDVFLDAFPW